MTITNSFVMTIQKCRIIRHSIIHGKEHLVSIMSIVRVGVSGNDCVNVLLWSADVLKSIDRAIIMKMLNSKL